MKNPDQNILKEHIFKAYSKLGKKRARRALQWLETKGLSNVCNKEGGKGFGGQKLLWGKALIET